MSGLKSLYLPARALAGWREGQSEKKQIASRTEERDDQLENPRQEVQRINSNRLTFRPIMKEKRLPHSDGVIPGRMGGKRCR